MVFKGGWDASSPVHQWLSAAADCPWEHCLDGANARIRSPLSCSKTALIGSSTPDRASAFRRQNAPLPAPASRPEPRRLRQSGVASETPASDCTASPHMWVRTGVPEGRSGPEVSSFTGSVSVGGRWALGSCRSARCKLHLMNKCAILTRLYALRRTCFMNPLNDPRADWSPLTRYVLGAVIALGLVIVGCLGEASAPPKTCVSGETVCSGQCVDTATNPKNCGACATACAAGLVCSSGACALVCSGKSTDCAGACVDTGVDPKNCGACGKSCEAGQVCNAGACVAQCPKGQLLCLADGGAVSCVTTDTDAANCGACGTKCDAGKACLGGKCTDNCGPGVTLCSGHDGGAPYCAITASDNANCGACGKTCAAGLVCVAGACTSNCGAGEILCPPQDGGAPYCAITASDNDNCGACGKACAAGLLCSSGSCVSQCSAGLTKCGQQCVDLQSDRDHCGSCGFKCSGLTPSCGGGLCSSISFVGSYDVSDGPNWSNDPPTYTCQEACAVVFGGAAASYQCSTVNSTPPNRKANTTSWGVSGCGVVADTYKLNATYDCGNTSCSVSAYCSDNCVDVNYCFK